MFVALFIVLRSSLKFINKRIFGSVKRLCCSHKLPLYVKPEILETFEHDDSASTQGLLWTNGLLYESTGLYGQSSIRCLNPNDGEELNRVSLDRDLYGEGIAQLDNRIVQLTWKSQRALLYNIEDLKLTEELTYQGEAWGLTNGDNFLIMTNGSNRLWFCKCTESTIQKRSSTVVAYGSGSLSRLNDLSAWGSYVVANVYGHDSLYTICTRTGHVVMEHDCRVLSKIAKPRDQRHILNGIANVPGTNNFYVAGKCWSKMFLVRLRHEQLIEE